MNRAKAELYKDESELFVFKEVFDWFVNKLDVNYPNRPISNYSYFREVKNKDEVCRVIRSLGTGITNYEERKSSLAELQQQMPKVIYERLEEDIEDWKNEETKGKKDLHCL